MRGNRIAVRGAVSIAALIALVGCSSGVEPNRSASTTAASTPSATPTSSSTVPAAGAFCTQATQMFTDLSPAFSSGSADPSTLAPLLQQLEAKVRAIDPPAEIAADWGKLADSLHAFSGLTSGLRPGDPAAASSFAAANARLLASLGTAATHIEEYVATNCGFTGMPSGLPSGLPTGSAAPTS